MKALTYFSILALALPATATSQSFSCNAWDTPACLGSGETVCSSTGKCVSDDAVCFNPHTCGLFAQPEDFICKSDAEDAINKTKEIAINAISDLQRQNEELLRNNRDLAQQIGELTDDMAYLQENSAHYFEEYERLAEHVRQLENDICELDLEATDGLNLLSKC